MKTCIYFSVKVLMISAFLTLFTGAYIRGQDIIIKKNGDEIKAKVEQVLDTGIEYRKFENLTGPIYSMAKADIFMIKYENGTSDVFGVEKPVAEPPVSVTTSTNTPAVIYFYRPRKTMGSPNEIIVGTVVPDEVIVKLSNGHWFKSDYIYTGQREFVTGIFSINEETLKLNVEAGEIYYVRCSIMKGMGMQSELETIDEETGRKEMNDLKEQKKAK